MLKNVGLGETKEIKKNPQMNLNEMEMEMEMETYDKRFEIDQLLSDCDYIQRHWSDQSDEASKRRVRQIDQLIEDAKFVDKVADEFLLGALPQNGFLTFLAIVSVFASEMVRQIKNGKRIDRDLFKLFDGLSMYRDFLLDLYGRLKSQRSCQESNESDGPSLMYRANYGRSKHLYRALK